MQKHLNVRFVGKLTGNIYWNFYEGDITIVTEVVLRTRTFQTFCILKINGLVLLCNLFMERRSYMYHHNTYLYRYTYRYLYNIYGLPLSAYEHISTKCNICSSLKLPWCMIATGHNKTHIIYEWNWFYQLFDKTMNW